MTERELLEQEIRNLVSELTAPSSAIGDWKIIKCYEAKLMGKEMPYDYSALIASRETVRKRINEIQEQLETMDIKENSIL